MMMAKVGRLRKFHRRDWPGFLNRVVPAGVWQRFAGNIPRPSDPRTRWSAKYVVLCWMVVGWSVQGALTERFREGWEVLARLFPRRRRPGTSYQSLTKATGRLGDRLLHQFWCSLRQSLPQRIGARWRWYGWTVLRRGRFADRCSADPFQRTGFGACGAGQDAAAVVGDLGHSSPYGPDLGLAARAGVQQRAEPFARHVTDPAGKYADGGRHGGLADSTFCGSWAARASTS